MNYINILAQAAPAAAPAEANATTTQPAAAGTAGADAPAPEGSMLGSILPFILIAVIFYFLLIRPQQKQQKELKARQEGLKPGDKVISAGGIYGIVREVMQNAVKLEIAPNVVIKMDKTSIVRNVSKDGSAEPEKK